MRVVFMGTPDFAVPTLQALCRSEHQVVGVVTQPDKPKGRGGKVQYPPVKEAALQEGIAVYQPDKVRDPDFLEILRELSPDVIVVAAFGQILPPSILQLPRYGCMNVHASLLPKLRGAAPIQWSVIQGDKESGVTIMQMDEGLDTGDILLTEKYTLKEQETGGSLFDALSALGGPLILKALAMAEAGTLQPVKQDETQHTYAGMLHKESGKLDFSRPAEELERLVRGLNPWPSAYTYLDGKMLKIWEAHVEDTESGELPGTIVRTGKEDFAVQTGAGCLVIDTLQLEGKKRMDTASFLRGYPLRKGMILSHER